MSAIATPTQITLNQDQENAKKAILAFLCDTSKEVFVLEGFSGCGKTTLITSLLHEIHGSLEAFMKTIRLIRPDSPDYEVILTATTNKAAENLERMTGRDTSTIHSALGLMVKTDFKTGKTELRTRSQMLVENAIVIIDEASFMDRQLLQMALTRLKNCKLILIGDPAQLIQFGTTSAPAFASGFDKVRLTEVVRQAKGNPIVDLSTKFRGAVESGEFFSFKPDGHHIAHMPRDEFNKKILAEFSRPNWKFADSKVLAWTNKTVIQYNQFIRQHVKGDPQFAPGDYAVVNTYVSKGKFSLKTDQLVCITDISDPATLYGVPGHHFTLDNSLTFFMPNSMAEKNAKVRQARKDEAFDVATAIESEWIDLRAAYACTINKSQGSTYDTVFIDLDDIRGCNSGDQIARMMYVAVSRARNHVYLTGDLA